MRAEWFDFIPEFEVWLAANHKPVIRGTDTGIWSRIRLIPFTVSFEGREDRELSKTLAAEAEGILAWAVRGCMEWQRNGLNPPEKVLEATKAYRAEMDTIGEFIKDKCELAPGSAENRFYNLKIGIPWADLSRRVDESSVLSLCRKYEPGQRCSGGYVTMGVDTGRDLHVVVLWRESHHADSPRKLLHLQTCHEFEELDSLMNDST